jgi:subtilisin family serine protease
MDDEAGAGKPGVILCASAGNEGRASFHASGRFGPRVDGQADIMSESVELFVTTKTELDVYFSHDDHWGLAITGLDKFFIDKKGQPDTFYVASDGKNIRAIADSPCKLPENVRAYFDTVQTDSASDGKSDVVVLPLPPGRYLVNGFGVDKEVKSGRYDLYLPFTDEATFGHGADKEFMVSSPGDAANVITVGAYYYRNSWTNLDGKATTYNLPIGDICSYSSPGYRRDGVVKPEICAPASYTISSLAAGSDMGMDKPGVLSQSMVTDDGVHLAWDGTSAASPYVAGVIALMLQKNPTLDEDKVRSILESTAKSDNFTGAVPNPHWGYGKIDPAAALAAVPAPDAKPAQ